MKITITLEDALGLPNGNYVITDPDECCLEVDTTVFRDSRSPEQKGAPMMTVRGFLVEAPEGIDVKGT